jgi:putative ABC transport system permease protein
MDGAGNITYLSIAALIIFIIPMGIINAKLKLGINKKMIYSLIRMAVQLTLVGFFLQYVFELNNAILNVGYFILMMAIAAWSTFTSNKFNKDLLLPLFISFLIPNIILLLFFTAVVLQLSYIVEAQYFIPIGGMLLGNGLRSSVVSINRFYDNLRKNKKAYEYSLGLSGNRKETLMPYFKESLISSVRPSLSNMETMGLVALPGMMTGQILAGAVPMEAVQYQIAIMLCIFISQYFTAGLGIIFTGFRAFNDYDQLIG